MHRTEKSKYLLYIEPKLDQKSEIPIDDHLTLGMEALLSSAKKGTANYSDLKDPGRFKIGGSWRGWHDNCDGKRSSSQDYLIADGRYITNSLAPHYLRWYRIAIPQWMIEAIEDIV